MITLNEQLIKAQTQTFDVVSIICDFRKGTITVETALYNENGEQIDTIIDVYKNGEANAYWEDFNSKKAVYEKLIEKHEIDVVVPEIPDVLKDVEPIEE